MKEKLATTTSITSTYAGEFAGQYIAAALKAAITIGDRNITIKENIKYKEVVKKLATASLTAAASCDFSDTGTVTLTERILTPSELQVNLELCKKDFHSDFEAIEMGMSAFDVLPKNFTDFLIANVSQSVGAELETKIWNSTTPFSGFTQLFAADSDVVDVAGLGTGITSSNVQAEIAKVVSALSALNIYHSGEKPVIYCATNIIMNYLISLGGFGASGLGSNGYKGEGPTGVQNAPLYYAGIRLVEAPGLPSNRMVGAQASNLWFGTGLLNDTNEVKVLDMADVDGSQNVRFIMRYSAGIQYGIGKEVVFYA